MSELIVIKFGGEIVESSDTLENLASSVAKFYKQGHQVVLIHGGGPVATKLSQQLNIIPNMVGGRRVTCEKTLEVMKMTLPGIVNSNVLAVLKKHQVPGIAVSGISFIDAVIRPPRAVSGSQGQLINFGYVGDVTNVKPQLLIDLLALKYIPVISPLCADAQGQVLNINADTVAVQIALAIKAKRFVAITKVGGVYRDLDDKQSRFGKLTMQEVRQLIEQQVIQAGMIPKLEEGMKLLEGGASSFHIVGVERPDSIAQEIDAPGSVGTVICQ